MVMELSTHNRCAIDGAAVGTESNSSPLRTSTPAPSIVSVFPGAGVNGSDRIELIWTDYSIRNQWLQVTVKADGNTALQGPQVFYFGNLVGETGHGSTSGNFMVSIGDVVGTKFHSGNPAGITVDSTSIGTVNERGELTRLRAPRFDPGAQEQTAPIASN